MQRTQLHEYEEQEDDDGASRVQEVLPKVPQAPATQGNKVN
jgi:hypothetical protein